MLSLEGKIASISETWQRRSIRLRDYDYASVGAYFITIVTRGRDYLFGNIIDRHMKLSALGEIVEKEWFRSAEIRNETELPKPISL
jgi:putative transposase